MTADSYLQFIAILIIFVVVLGLTYYVTKCGNFGCTAGIAEMLVQSHTGKVVLLPALPDVWKDGTVKGLQCRGGFILEELTWKDGKPAIVKVRSTVGGKLDIAWNGSEQSLDTKAGKEYSIKF